VSEYQYYDFKAIDHVLTKTEMVQRDVYPIALLSAHKHNPRKEA
jgi:hypothetical protein